MPLTPGQQDLYDIGADILPPWWFQNDAAQQEMLNAYAVIMDSARQVVDGWVSETYILTSDSIWLDQHARDRGTSRQNNESDPALQKRLRTVEDAVTPSAVLSAASDAMIADGLTPGGGYPALVELRRDRAFMGTYSTPAPVDSPNSDGRKMAYLSRGYRMTGLRGSIIIILPFGTSQATADSVAEAVRLKRAAGFPSRVERRLDP